MSRRVELHEKLTSILGSRYVYYQPPESIKLHYPCIIYKLDRVNQTHADNKPYRMTDRYQVTVIDKRPDSPYPRSIMELPMCTYNNTFITNNLNHFVLSLYY